MEWKKIIPLVIVGIILGIAISYFSFNQRTTKLESEIDFLKKDIKQLEKRIEGSIVEESDEASPTKVKIAFYGDQNHNEIEDKSAPFIIYIEGTVSNAKDKFLYLIVDDSNALWIQPGLGANINGEFSGNYYLGIKDDPNSLNKWYKIFAVITNKEYKAYEHLDMKTVIAESKKIKLYRTKI
ncbi:MAG: hypothetical protein JW866_07310 [Ignavibacteriales bacterium]|nr:hypothetical protein [Ignavibacteriales bacterium]